MSPAAELMIFGPRTALFNRYGNYYATRYSEESHEPLTEPVTEFREALVLLYEGMNDKTQRFLRVDARLKDGTVGPAICIQVYNGGYGKCEFSGEHLFPIALELVEELKQARLVSGTPRMGYTDMSELHLNDTAIDRIIEEANKYKMELEAV